MQVILKQSEITAALAAYMVNVLGATGVTPETLNVVYKQGRADKNGMTAELEIEAPKFEKQPFGVAGGDVFIEAATIGKASDASAVLTQASEPDAIAISEEVEARAESAVTFNATARVEELKEEGISHLAEDVPEVLTVPAPEVADDEPVATSSLFGA